jgi:hypothetical protein
MRMNLWAMVVATALCPVAGSAAEAARGISGAWRLDPEKSEDVRQKMRAQMERERGPEGGMRGPGGGMGGPGGGGMGRPGGGGMGRPGGGGMGRPGGGGMGGPGGGGPGGPRGGDPRQMREAMDELLVAPNAMAITAGEAEVEIAEQDGRLRRLRADGRKAKREGSAVSETRTRWDGAALVTESWLGDHLHVTETFRRDDATGELRVKVRIDGPRGQPVTAERVYVPETIETAGPS